MNNKVILSKDLEHPPEPDYMANVSYRKESLFRQMIRGKVHPMPGVRTWLERLQSMGCRQAVASSAPMANIDALVDEMQIRAYFSAIVSAYDMPSKPDPAVFLEAARQLALPPKKCVVIEDAIPGVNAAHRAGMKCIAITTTNPRQDLSEADIILDNLEDLKLEYFK
jgi:HAD superfamily hydrolase (TIGR01509 family)